MNSNKKSRKEVLVENRIHKLKKIISKAEKEKNNELILEATEAIAIIECSWNQRFTDDYLEQEMKLVCNRTRPEQGLKENKNKVCIFHDGFGVDMWSGLMYIYVSALLSLGYQIIYITNEDKKDSQPEFHKAMEGENIVYEYYQMCGMNRIRQAADIDYIIKKYTPSIAFLYIPPWDTSSILAYSWNENIKRFFINATDHTFWVGKSAFDVCIEFRNYGAAISEQYRKIAHKQIAILPFYPVVNQNIEFQGFPFQTEGYKILFSGGAPYKTYDKNNSYFKMVDSVLSKHRDVIFIYAPQSSELRCKEVKAKYPDRFFTVEKRKDLFQVLKRVYAYISTYPIMGGLMTQYAVMAGKYPFTVWNEDAQGLVLGEDERTLFYDTIEDMENDLDKALDNEEYLCQKEKKLEGRVISEVEFRRELAKIIKYDESKYKVLQVDGDVNYLQRTMKERFGYSYICNRAISRDESRPQLLKYFPILFLKKEFQVACILLKDIFARKKSCE